MNMPKWIQWIKNTIWPPIPSEELPSLCLDAVLGPAPKRPYRLQVYQVSSYADAGRWRWRLLAGNHLFVAESVDTYARKSHAIRAANTLRREAGHAVLEIKP